MQDSWQTEDRYYLYRHDSQEGPYTLYEIRRMIHHGHLKRSDRACNEHGGVWISVGEIPHLYSNRSRLAALILSFFLGVFGLDRLYLGYYWSSFFKGLTCGLCGVWLIVDFVMILLDELWDASGRPLRP